MKPKQQPVFLNAYLDENGKRTFSETRKQKTSPTVIEVPGGNLESELKIQNSDIDVPNEKLPGQFARNRAARRVIAAIKRRADKHK